MIKKIIKFVVGVSALYIISLLVGNLLAIIFGFLSVITFIWYDLKYNKRN